VFVLFRCGDDLVVCDRVYYILLLFLLLCNARSSRRCFVAERVDERRLLSSS